MPQSVTCILWLAATLTTLTYGAYGKPPGWVPMLIICIIGLLTCLPLR